MSYHPLRVSAVRRLTPHMARISFAVAADVEDVGPDQYVKLFFPAPGQVRPVLPPPLDGDEVLSWYRVYLAMPDAERPPMRTYTIRAIRPGEVDVDFVLHDAGPASTWAERAAVGDELIFLTPPHALYSPPEDTEWQLLVGDESTVPAVGAIVESRPEDAVLRAFVEVAGPEEEQVFETAAKDVEITWVHRGTRPHGEAVLEAVRAASLPEGKAYGWLSGEASLVKYARRHLVRERGVDKRAITFTGYWRQGKSEEEVGRENVKRIESGAPEPADDV
ncbi:siderophore-interacting protein [Amycolatopsis albispora]|uniref:NADPH-dependent ferric siderophore reductase n=1 Tax=Amycolatopsis albispora TaxID=1804986 RepID=A0A344LGK5_9PSEU|nr:siderophore-interacting protein [Amycolatopsis albispora]AXB47179.1 NADPH-dependent ferric siderophore reductase [Amycolatopsis albispora]